MTIIKKEGQCPNETEVAVAWRHVRTLALLAERWLTQRPDEASALASKDCEDAVRILSALQPPGADPLTLEMTGSMWTEEWISSPSKLIH